MVSNAIIYINNESRLIDIIKAIMNKTRGDISKK